MLRMSGFLTVRESALVAHFRSQLSSHDQSRLHPDGECVVRVSLCKADDCVSTCQEGLNRVIDHRGSGSTAFARSDPRVTASRADVTLAGTDDFAVTGF